MIFHQSNVVAQTRMGYQVERLSQQPFGFDICRCRAQYAVGGTESVNPCRKEWRRSPQRVQCRERQAFSTNSPLMMANERSVDPLSESA